MRIRPYFAGGFFAILLLAGYLGLAPSTIPNYGQSDKVLHFVTFFLLTICFYWILEANRRRNLQLTLFVCPVVLGVGSEIIQGLLPNGRDFDPYDILANVAGSLAALALCSWYHRRMLERKRQAKNYAVVPGDDVDDMDLELGEGIGAQETGVIDNAPPTTEEEVDNWDENAWDEDEPVDGPETGEGERPKRASTSVEDSITDSKKRND